MKLAVYKRLRDINAGFDEAISGLAALRKFHQFHALELDQCTSLAKEVRAATNSYLAGVVEQAETGEAGRRFRKRRGRERQEESGQGRA